MTKNIGAREANIRTTIAAVLVVVVFFFVTNPYVHIVLALIAAILAGTAFLRTCPINRLLGRNTCEVPTPPDTEEQPADSSPAQTLRE